MLPGAKCCDPLDPGRHLPGWVLVPEQHFLLWDRYTVEALSCMSEALDGRFKASKMRFLPIHCTTPEASASSTPTAVARSPRCTPGVP